MSHTIQIPHDDGLVHVYHSAAPMEYPEAAKILRARHGISLIQVADIQVIFDGVPARLWFRPDPDLGVNTKATELCAEVFGWHMVFNGDVLIDGLSERQVEEYVRSLS